MIKHKPFAVRPALPPDRQRVANLIHFERYTHRHLDWRSPLDWLGSKFFFLLEKDGQLVGAIACPPDPPEIGWIRLFSAAAYVPVHSTWQTLWTSVLDQVKESAHFTKIAALPLNHWFRDLVAGSGFQITHSVVMLAMDVSRLPAHQFSLPDGISLRSMSLDDLPAIQAIDEAAFQPIWRNSLDSLGMALSQADTATVAEYKGTVVGYQISTGESTRVHLARLAVHPQYQRRQIGKSILLDVLSHFKKRGVDRITVNTQSNNLSSLNLYQSSGFVLTGEEYPVFEFAL